MQAAAHSSTYYSLWADVILLVHFAFVAFVLLGLLLTWIGYFLQWSFVRNFWFRLAHLLAIGVVAVEAIGGIVCPLTRWEADLRWKAGASPEYAGSFMQHWVHKIMFFDLPESAFTAIYSVFFLWWRSAFGWSARGCLIGANAKISPEKSLPGFSSLCLLVPWKTALLKIKTSPLCRRTRAPSSFLIYPTRSFWTVMRGRAG